MALIGCFLLINLNPKIGRGRLTYKSMDALTTVTEDNYGWLSGPSPPHTEVKDDFSWVEEMEFVVTELYGLFAFCALYSSVVMVSLWMTAEQAVRVRIDK